MGILDEIVGRYDSSRPVILSEQHDVNKIDVGSGGSSAKLPSDRLKDQIKSIGSGGWDEAEYGIRREQQIAILTESLNKALEYEKTPEGIEAARVEAEKTLLDIRERAIRRAGLDTSNGRVNVFVAGKSPWHKLGVNVAEAVNSADARRLAGIDWLVQKVPLNYRDAKGNERQQEEAYGIIREDTGAFLGSVGSRYKPIQNSDGFDVLDSVLEKFGAKYESAGSLFGGKKVWMLAHLPQQSIKVGGKDQVECYALLANPHDGSGVGLLIPTSERVVCANTLRVAANGNEHKGLRLRHTGNIKDRVAEAQVALGLAVKGFEKFGEQANALANTPIPNAKNYFNDVLDAALEITEAQRLLGADVLTAALKVTEANRELVRKSFEKKIERRGEILEEILNRHESERCGINGIRGSAWGCLNAVTEYCDHGKLKQRQVGDEESRLSRRFESSLVGDADEIKQIAFSKALEYANR